MPQNYHDHYLSTHMNTQLCFLKLLQKNDYFLNYI